MKILTLCEKRIETRSWRTHYRGPLAIHASKGGWTMDQVLNLYHEQPLFRVLSCRKLYPGHIVAIVNLLDCCPMEDTGCLAGVFSDYPELDTPKERAFGDYTPGRWAWVTEDVFRLPEPIPYKGGQGLRDLSREVVQQIKAQGWRGICTWRSWGLIVADRAYELGLIAGRKQAIAQLPDAGLIRAWDTKRKLRQWANALAKKARAK